MKVNIIEKTYFIFLLLLPFVHFSITVDPVLIPRQIYLAAFLLLVIFLLYSQKDNQIIPFNNPSYLAIGSFISLSIVSSYGNFTTESFYVLSKQLVICAFLLITIHVLYNKILHTEYLIKGCIGIGIIALVGAYYQWIEKTIDGEKIFRRAGLVKSFFANKNLLASILFMCLPFFLMGLKQSKKIKIISLVGMLSAIPIIILLGTRAVFLAIVVFGLLILCYYLKTKYGIRKRIFGLASVIFLVIMILSYINLVVPKVQDIATSKSTTAQYFYRIANSNTIISRTKFWNNSIAMWKEKPLLGVGFGNWQVEFPKYGLDKMNTFSIANGTETLQRPHNDFLNILCENGLLGLIAYCLIFGVIYYQLLFLIKNTKVVAEKWNFIYLFAGISGYLVISFFDFPMERIEHQILLMIFFAITTSSYYSIKELKLESKIRQYQFMYGIAAVSLYALVVAGFRFKGEMETVKMYIAKEHEQWNEMLHYANRAENYFYKIDPTSIPIDWYKGIASANLKEIDQSLVYFESAYHQAPYQIQVINNLASTYEFLGKRQKAIEFFQKALQISTDFEEARLNLAAVYFNDKQYDKAFDVIDKMKVDYTNKRYKKYLIPILEKKINAVLMQKNDMALSRNLAKRITRSQHIYNLYLAAKKNHVSFETEILSMK